MPEWADAVFVLCGTIVCVVAFRYGAAARPSRERARAAARFGRLVMSAGGVAASIATATVFADGSIPVIGWVMFGLAGIALGSGVALRLGAGWPSTRA